MTISSPSLDRKVELVDRQRAVVVDLRDALKCDLSHSSSLLDLCLAHEGGFAVDRPVRSRGRNRELGT